MSCTFYALGRWSGAEWSGRAKYHSKYVAPEFELSESVLEHSRLTAAHSAVDYVTALHCVLYCCIFTMSVACLIAALRHHLISSRLSEQLWRKTPFMPKLKRARPWARTDGLLRAEDLGGVNSAL